MPRFGENGHEAPKGQKAKFAKTRDDIMEVFERMGGVIRMTAWAEENPTLFYTQVLPKVIVREIAGKVEVEHRQVVTLSAEELSERTRKYLERRAPAAPDSVRH